MTQPTPAELVENDLVGGSGDGRGRKLVIALSVAAILLAVLMVWSVPRPTGDLYVGLAAGRDIVDGKLGQEDDWAFTTKGRVWVNQNWGTNLAYWVSHKLGGESGLLTLKLLMLMAGSGFLVLACRHRNAGWPIALLVAAGAIAAGRSFIDLRPNLTTLMFVPVMLFLLYRTEKHPRRIWLTMVVFGVIWANLHGGFTLGLAAMFFWAFCVVILPMIGRDRLAMWVPGVANAASVAAVYWYAAGGGQDDGRAAKEGVAVGKMIALFFSFAVPLSLWWIVRVKVFGQDQVPAGEQAEASFGVRAKLLLRRKWPYIAAAFGAVVLAGTVTPFGIHNAFRDFSKLSMPFTELWNLTHPYVVTFGEKSDIWRQVIEWRSVFLARPQTFGTSWEFFTIVGIFCALVPLSVAVKVARKKLLSVEDAVLLAVIFGLCAVIVIQAQPIYDEFGKILVRPGAYGLGPRDVDGVEWQRVGWLTVLIMFPLIGLFTSGAAIAAVSAWVRDRKSLKWSAERIGVVVFDVSLAMGGIWMAFRSRRFMPLACMLLAPLLARRMQWLVEWTGAMLGRVGSAPTPAKGRKPQSLPPVPVLSRSPLPTMILAGALIVTISYQGVSNYKRYKPNSPLVHYRSVLKNMITYHESFPPHAKDFILANGLAGPCFNEWRWEGYLRWYCPQLKMFVGGRAQQAYSIETYQTQQITINGMDRLPSDMLKPALEILRKEKVRTPLELLEKRNTRWIIVPNSGMYASLIYRASQMPGSRWSPVFSDGLNIILANSRVPECQAVIEKCLKGQLEYPDKAYAHLSRAMCLASAKINMPAEALADLKKAQQLKPIEEAYRIMGDLYARVKVLPANEIAYLEAENRRLAEMDWNRMGGFDILRCRFYVLSLLANFYEKTGQNGDLNRIHQQGQMLNEMMAEIFEDWV